MVTFTKITGTRRCCLRSNDLRLKLLGLVAVVPNVYAT